MSKQLPTVANVVYVVKASAEDSAEDSAEGRGGRGESGAGG